MQMDQNNIIETESKCQIFSLPQVSLPVGITRRLWQFRNRIKRIAKRRLTYLKNVLLTDKPVTKTISESPATIPIVDRLRPGEAVRIRSRNEIQATLNHWNQLKGCAFMEEMWPYCNSQQRVLKTVENFLDERDYIAKRCKGIVVLEGVLCEGTRDFGKCDRACHFFWREEWLERIESVSEN